MGRIVYALVRLGFTLIVMIPARIIGSIIGGMASRRALERGCETVRVVNVLDGDTVYVKRTGGVGESVRLIGIDAFESDYNDRLQIQVKNTGMNAENVIRMGKMGTEALRIILKESGADRRANLEFDAVSRDKYGRLLAYIKSPDGSVNVNAAMARTGYAVPFTMRPNCRYEHQIRDFSRQAERERTGLWGDWWEKDFSDMRNEISAIIPEIRTEPAPKEEARPGEDLREGAFSEAPAPAEAVRPAPAAAAQEMESPCL